jgi:hypothetical protein
MVPRSRLISPMGFTDLARGAPAGLLVVFAAGGAAAQASAGAGAARAEPARVTWRATGGTVDSSGFFRAGGTAGRYRVIATERGSTRADTSTISIASPPATTLISPPAPPPSEATTRTPSPAPSAGGGIPFGPYGAWEDETLKANTESFNLSIGAFTARNIIPRLTHARAQHHRVILAMTGGSHNQYKTDGVFDQSKWLAKMNTYDRPDIHDAIAQGVADGTIVGASVMDEPHNTAEGSSWGPKGTMTKARVDSMCAYVKQMFPTLPVGVVHDHDIFQPRQSYHVCEFLVDQYAARKGDVTEFRDAGLALGRRDNMSIVFSLNIISGGIQAPRDGAWNCSPTLTGGRGSDNPNCRMTAEQVRDWGLVLGPAGCALTMWRYDPEFMARPDNEQAFRDVAAKLATLPARSCGRPSPGM